MKPVKFHKAPAIKVRICLNGPAPTAEELKGKVRLVYFFSIGEPSSLAALPLLRYYDLRLRDDIRVIGVHVPKYEKERKKENVEKALNELDVHFPVALDNHMKIWKAYRNQYWGQVHIIDGKGRMRHYHAGENVEEEVEQDVYYVLKDTNSALDIRPRLGEIEAEGKWYVTEDYLEHVGGEKDSVKIRYEGTKFALGVSTPESAEIEVRLDGKPVPNTSRDKDVVEKGRRTVVEAQGEKHLHVIKEELDHVHEVEFLVRKKDLRITGFYS